MPSLQSDLEMAKRRNRILRLEKLIEMNQGEPKYKVMGLFMMNYGVKKSTFYEYLQVLIDASRVVEKIEFGSMPTLWTVAGWTAERAHREEEGLKVEVERTKINSLDAYQLEET